MPRLPIEEVLPHVERLVEPRPEFAQELFARFEAALADEVLVEEPPPRPTPTPARAPRARRSWMRPAIGFGLALLIALATVVLNVIPGGERSALAVIRDAQRAYADLPPFEATVIRRQSGKLLAEESLTVESQPDVVVERHIAYQDDAHFRVDVVDNSYDDRTEPPTESFEPSAGSFAVADGQFFAEYTSRDNNFRVLPVEEVRGGERRYEAVELLNPALTSLNTDQSTAYFEENCDVLPDETVAGRRSHRVHCEEDAGGGRITDSDIWVDAATGVVLRYHAGDVITGSGLIPVDLNVLEVTEIDFAPDFAPDAFEIDAPNGASIVWAGDGPSPARFTPELDPQIAAQIPLGGSGSSVLYAHGSLWVSAIEGGSKGGLGYVVRIDPVTNKVIARIDLTPLSPEMPRCCPGLLLDPYDLFATDDGVWVAESQFTDLEEYGAGRRGDFILTMEQIDPATSEVVGDVRYVAQQYGSVELAGDTWWSTSDKWRGATTIDGVRCQCVNSLLRLDPTTGEVDEEFRLGVGIHRIDVDHGAVWVGAEIPAYEPVSPVLLRVDPRSGRVLDEIELASEYFGITDVEIGEGAVWVYGVRFQGGDAGRGVLIKVDPRSGNVVKRVEFGREPADLVVGEGFVWTIDASDKLLRRIDPGTVEVVGRPIRLGSSPRQLALGGGALWVTDYYDDQILRINIYR